MKLKLLIISVLILQAVSTLANTDSLIATDGSAIRNFFQSLTPDFERIQYAGSTGLLNAGLGWEYGKNSQHETDMMFGYVPKYEKSSGFFTFTLRQTYVPFKKPLFNDALSVQPLSCGIFMSSVFNSEYWVRCPERYPNSGYYFFPLKIRIHLFVGQRYTFVVSRDKQRLFNTISAVWELSTCDLYILSKAHNSTLPFHETLSLSLGVKVGF